MPSYTFTQETMPTPEEFALLLREGRENYDPVEELLQLEREFVELERKYGMPSDEFHKNYRHGLAGDSVEIIGWAGKYQAYLRLKHAISKSLELVLVQDYIPVP